MKKTFLYSITFFVALLFSFAAVASAKGGRGSYSYSSGTSYSHSSSGTSPSYSTSGKSSSQTSSHSSSGSNHSVSHNTASSYSSSPAHSHNSGVSTSRKSTRCASCPRDTNGHIKRSPQARSAFMKSHPCPSTGKTSGPCPGYVVDHIKALKHGGADKPENMQWQTTEAAKEKDKWE